MKNPDPRSMAALGREYIPRSLADFDVFPPVFPLSLDVADRQIIDLLCRY